MPISKCGHNVASIMVFYVKLCKIVFLILWSLFFEVKRNQMIFMDNVQRK